MLMWPVGRLEESLTRSRRRSTRVRVQVRLVGNRPVFSPPKGGKDRDVPLAGAVASRWPPTSRRTRRIR